MKINRRLLPVKAHYFFFMAASGPILPYLTVYGKQLGISEVVMGSITAVVPITFILAKPIFGFLADYFYNRRKFIFMGLIMSMSLFYLCLYFIPPVNLELKYSNSGLKELNNSSMVLNDSYEDPLRDELCNVTCLNESFTSRCQNSEGDQCFASAQSNATNLSPAFNTCHDTCVLRPNQESHIFRSYEFYGFLVLITLSMIAYNVSNSISDAICFDVLGDGQEKKYGYQRVWGTIGFGITALLGGIGMDVWSEGGVKNYVPAFFIIIVFTFFDMICCMKLKLPKIKMSENILKDLLKVIRHKSIIIFVVFATLVGVLDGFIIYFMFWFLEDLATASDQMEHIKVLEGLTVAAETLGGEIIFFLLSGKILKSFGYGHTLSLCFLNYALRLWFISCLSNPWWIVAVELFMQGPTYALCYTTIVAYASAIAPPGTSATVQGIIAGMDDGVGYSVGSLMGGFLYKVFGGRITFRIFCAISLICCVSHTFLYVTILRKSYNKESSNEYKPPTEAVVMA